MCSVQFANLHNFEIMLHILEIPKLQTNFEIAQPLSSILEIAQEPRAQGQGEIDGKLKATLFLLELEL